MPLPLLSALLVGINSVVSQTSNESGGTTCCSEIWKISLSHCLFPYIVSFIWYLVNHCQQLVHTILSHRKQRSSLQFTFPSLYLGKLLTIMFSLYNRGWHLNTLHYIILLNTLRITQLALGFVHVDLCVDVSVCMRMFFIFLFSTYICLTLVSRLFNLVVFKIYLT